MNSASASSIQIQLPDGTLAEHPSDTTAMDVALGISEGLARGVIAAKGLARQTLQDDQLVLEGSKRAQLLGQFAILQGGLYRATRLGRIIADISFAL